VPLPGSCPGRRSCLCGRYAGGFYAEFFSTDVQQTARVPKRLDWLQAGEALVIQRLGSLPPTSSGTWSAMALASSTLMESLQEFLYYVGIQGKLVHRKAKHSVTVLAQVSHAVTTGTSTDDVHVIDIDRCDWTIALRAFSSVHVDLRYAVDYAVNLSKVTHSWKADFKK
jgi:hypothetical protein